MNRRGFFGTIGKVTAGFMILPGAGRVWKAVVDPMPVVKSVVYEVRFSECAGEWYWFKDNRFGKVRQSEFHKELENLERCYARRCPDTFKRSVEGCWIPNNTSPSVPS